ncbi:MAG: hypothetical protein SFW09_22300 [Hyphomicrobiaceae bacterium]|nr:hypothetical protein [Hyphomicrobiaceae bacterium]
MKLPMGLGAALLGATAAIGMAQAEPVVIKDGTTRGQFTVEVDNASTLDLIKALRERFAIEFEGAPLASETRHSGSWRGAATDIVARALRSENFVMTDGLTKDGAPARVRLLAQGSRIATPMTKPGAGTSAVDPVKTAVEPISPPALPLASAATATSEAVGLSSSRVPVASPYRTVDEKMLADPLLGGLYRQALSADDSVDLAAGQSVGAPTMGSGHQMPVDPATVESRFTEEMQRLGARAQGEFASFTRRLRSLCLDPSCGR